MLCKNCGHEVEGNFCQHCGQRTNVGRIDFYYLAHEIPNSVFQLDRGFFFTVKELFTRPGHSIREFISGKRKYFYKPIAYLLITTTFYILSTFLMGTNTLMVDLLIGFKSGMEASDSSQGQGMVDWVIRNQTYLTFLVLPLFSLASYLTFARSGYNYVEHLVLNLYITGQQMIIYLIFVFFIVEENVWMATPIILAITYNIWTYLQFFKEKSLGKKTLLIALSYFLFIAIPIGLAFIAWVLVKIIAIG
ncbi:MAG: DUF3667 domain-containing protein [Bacteroidota bacterium]